MHLKHLIFFPPIFNDFTVSIVNCVMVVTFIARVVKYKLVFDSSIFVATLSSVPTLNLYFYLTYLLLP